MEVSLVSQDVQSTWRYLQQGRLSCKKPRHVLESRRSYAEGGLTKWFKEDWRDVKTGKKCGRSGSKDKNRPYPACRPAAVAGRISKSEARKKTGAEES